MVLNESRPVYPAGRDRDGIFKMGRDCAYAANDTGLVVQPQLTQLYTRLVLPHMDLPNLPPVTSPYAAQA